MTNALLLVSLAQGAWGQALTLPHEMYQLDNGLNVILHEDHDLPLVQVNLWYHVGSKDEVEGRSGFAHLFEHLMFQGSQNIEGEYFAHLQEVGGRVNGTTNGDRTNYFEGVPSHYLPLALWLEADRMGWLLPALDEGKLDNQRLVVRNERRQSYENRPYGTSWLTILDALYPDGHPYEHSTIGSHEDLENATLEDVHAFFESWYVPNNASLVIAGDFDPDRARALVQRYFGDIPAGDEPAHIEAPHFTLEEELVLHREEAGVPHQKVWIAWPSPSLYEDGDAELDLLSSVLTGGKESALSRRLVHDLQIAKEVDASQVSRTLTSMYLITATAAEGHSTEEIVEEIDRILAEIVANGPTEEEIEIGIANWEARYFRMMGSLRSKANQLNSYFFHTGEPDSLQWDLNRYRQVTPEGVRAQAEATLEGSARIILHIHPEEAE